MGKLNLWYFNEGSDYSERTSPVCLLVSDNGTRVDRFLGEDIPGVVKVLDKSESSRYARYSKRYNFRSASLADVSVCKWTAQKDREWAQVCWEDAKHFVEDLCLGRPGEFILQMPAFQACVRKHWPSVADEYDRYESVYLELSAATRA